jgi:hypothetical protein
MPRSVTIAIAPATGLDVLRRFEARFHPNQADQGDYVIVGYVIWDSGRADGQPRVEAPSTISRHATPHLMFATLRHLVRIAGPLTHERLMSLPSTHWSFVDTSSSA